MDIRIKPLDDHPQFTLNSISTALGVFLGSTKSQVLDAGQFEMLREAAKRLEMVEEELGQDNAN